jgi:hypothetical protein
MTISRDEIVRYLALKCGMMDKQTQQTLHQASPIWRIVIEDALPYTCGFKTFNVTPSQAIDHIKAFFDNEEDRDFALKYYKALCILSIKEMGIKAQDLE